MTGDTLFPDRIETERLAFERFDEHVDLYEFVGRDDWQGAATEHIPWFCFERVDEVVEFVDAAERRWTDGERARYLLRRRTDDAIVGTAAYVPEWEPHRAGSDIVLAREYWGDEYGLERASAFVELTFETYDLDAYYTTCAAGNEPSRRMIEKYVKRYGGRHEDLLRQHSPRPGGEVTDQHRFTITEAEYREATADRETLQFAVEW